MLAPDLALNCTWEVRQPPLSSTLRVKVPKALKAACLLAFPMGPRCVTDYWYLLNKGTKIIYN